MKYHTSHGYTTSGIVIFVLALAVLIVGVWTMSARDSAPQVGSTPDEVKILGESDQQKDARKAPSDQNASPTVKEVTVTGKNFEFSPKEIRVKKGETVRITFMNTGGYHDWALDGYNVKTKQIEAGKSDTIEFVASTPGSFQYYCSVGNHRAMGMIGTLIVE